MTNPARLAQLERSLQAADAAGDEDAVRVIAREVRRERSVYSNAPGQDWERGRELEQAASRLGAPQWLQGAARRGDAAFEGLSHGLTFGFQDELLGAVQGADEREASRERLEGARATYPGTTTTAEIVGGAHTGAVAPGAMFSSLPRAAASGAAMGGLFGVGTGQGGLGERIAGAGDEALMGGLFGAGGYGVGKLIGAVASGLKGASSAARDRAMDMVRRRLEQSGLTPADIRTVLNELRAAGGAVEEGLMDVGGANVQGLTRAAANVEGPGKEMIRSRLVERAVGANPERVTDEALQGAGRRIAERGFRSLGLGRRQTSQALEQGAEGFQAGSRAINEQASQAARPLYEAAVAEPFPIEATQELFEPLVQDPIMGRIWRRTAGRALLLTRGQPASGEQRALSALAKGAMPDPGDMTVGVLHRFRRAINDEIGVAARNGEREAAGALIGFRNEMLDPWIAKTPQGGAYETARRTVHSGHQMTEALQGGRNVFNTPEEEFWGWAANLSEPERQAAALGAMRAVVERAGRNPNARQAIQLVLNGNIRERLRALWPRDARGGERPVNDFFRRLMRERSMQETMNYVLGGSRTTPLAEEITAATLKESPMSAILDEIESVIRGQGAAQVGRNAMAGLFNRFRQRGLYNQGVNREVSEIVSQRLSDDLIDELAQAVLAARAKRGAFPARAGARVGEVANRGVDRD